MTEYVRIRKEGPIHESGIAANIIEIAEKAAKKNGLSTVRRVDVQIGAFSGVEPELLTFAFSVLKKKTTLAEAELEIIKLPLLLYCRDCETDYVGESEDLRCPICLGENYDIKQGRELKVIAISGG
ncbi:MAG: hydrogenase maturation nickel metallochaperone HypA [Anaerolineaceae bacterium]|nr:hydrogenase maturation nickel metallochaperone HypA [Anaerolineaceae bacterium]